MQKSQHAILRPGFLEGYSVTAEVLLRRVLRRHLVRIFSRDRGSVRRVLRRGGFC